MRRFLIVFVLAPTFGACSDFATAPDRRPEALRVTPDTVVVTRGDAVQFTVQVLDQDGTPFERVPFWSPPYWTVSNNSLLTLDAAGAGQALEAGESTAQVEVAGLSAEAVVRTNPNEISVDVPFAYITQSTQRQDGGVPLIAGREGLVRVYLTANSVNFFQPRVRVSFYNGGNEVHSLLLEPDAASIPDEIDEGDLRLSYDAVVPGEIIQPGIEMVVEVDPEGALPAMTGSQMRVPAAGSTVLDVREVTPFLVRLVPVDQSANGRITRLNATSIVALTGFTEDAFPLDLFDVDLREPYTTEAALDTRQGWSQLITEIRLLRLADESDRYYYGTFDPPSGSGIAGLGYIGYPTSIGIQNEEVVGHELGHNVSLRHAPCGGPNNPDPEYLYLGGRIGHFGYDRSTSQLRDPIQRVDFMSYCDPVWISDYNYDKIMVYRDTSEWDNPTEGASAASGPRSVGAASGQRTLVVWGAVVDGQMSLEPALQWTGRVALPSLSGSYTLEGLDEEGQPVFDLSFEPLELDHIDARQFLFALPADLAQPDRLARIRFSGPEGTVQRFRAPGRTPVLEVTANANAGFGQPGGMAGRWSNNDYPLAIVRSRATGRILAISRSGTVPLGAGANEVEVFLSDGVRSFPANLVQR